MSEHNLIKALRHVQSITVVRVLIIVSFAMLLVSSLILYEARTSFLQKHVNVLTTTVQPSSLKLNPVGVKSLTDFMESHRDIAALGVVAVDMEENTRLPLVTLYNDDHVKNALEAAEDKQPQPLFTNDPQNNANVSALLNGEFVCVPHGSVTHVGRVKSEPLIKTTCRVPIPPYYGKLMGYLVIHSVHELSIYEIDRLRRDALRLSIDIYYANTSRVLNIEDASALN